MIIKYITNGLLLLTFVDSSVAAPSLAASPRGLRVANETIPDYEQQVHVAHLRHHEDLARAQSNEPAVFYGRFWYDNNHDKKFNNGKEQGVKGGRVSLKRKTVVGDRTKYTVVKTKRVKWNGKFEIPLYTIKANSVYYLKFIHNKTAYYKFEQRSRGGDSYVENEKGNTSAGAVKNGEKYRLNAGLIVKKGAMFFGRIWLDTNGNGEIDKGEKGIKGGSVALYQQTPSGKKFIKKKKANSDGTYEMPIYKIQKDTKYFVKLYGHDKGKFVYSPKLSSGDSHVSTKNGSSWPRIVEEGKRYHVNAGIMEKPMEPLKPDPNVCADYELFNKETKTPLQGSCDAYDKIYQDLCPEVDDVSVAIPNPQFKPPGGESPTCSGYCCGAYSRAGDCPNSWKVGLDYLNTAFRTVIVPTCDGKEQPNECEVVLVREKTATVPYKACSVGEGNWIFPSISCWTGNDGTDEIRLGMNTKVTLCSGATCGSVADITYSRTEMGGPEAVKHPGLSALRVECITPDSGGVDPDVCKRYEFFDETTQKPLAGGCYAYDEIYQDLCPPVNETVPFPEHKPPGGQSKCAGYCCGAGSGASFCPNKWGDSWVKAFPSVIVPECDGKEQPDECEVVLVRHADNPAGLDATSCSVSKGNWIFPSIDCWTGDDLTDEIRIGVNTKVFLREHPFASGGPSKEFSRTKSGGPEMVEFNGLSELRVECTD